MDHALRALIDRMLIRELIDEYSNVCTQKAWDRLPGLLAPDCAWRTRGSVARDFEGREAVVAAIRGVVEGYRMVFQMPHAPRIELDGDRATAITLINEIVHADESHGRFILAVYHDRLVRTAEGWKFAERVFKGTHIEPFSLPGQSA